MSYSTSESTLNSLFSEFGTVDSVNLIMDRDTNRPKGFAFVEMDDDSAAVAAISQLDGRELDGRNLRVNEAIAKERTERRPSYNRY